VRNPSRRLAWGLTESTKEFPQEYETITVCGPRTEKQIKGVALNEDNFSVQMIDASEQIYLLEKDKLRSFHKSRESFMPQYNSKRFERQRSRGHHRLPDRRGDEMTLWDILVPIGDLVRLRPLTLTAQRASPIRPSPEFRKRAAETG